MRSNRKKFSIIEPLTGKEVISFYFFIFSHTNWVCFQVRKRSKDLRVGDLVYLYSDLTIPADLLVLGSDLPNGICYIQTSQLDGETTLKIRKPPQSTAGLDRMDIANLEGVMECDLPNHELYSFNGVLKLFSKGSVYSKANFDFPDPDISTALGFFQDSLFP